MEDQRAEADWFEANRELVEQMRSSCCCEPIRPINPINPINPFQEDFYITIRFDYMDSAIIRLLTKNNSISYKDVVSRSIWKYFMKECKEDSIGMKKAVKSMFGEGSK